MFQLKGSGSSGSVSQRKVSLSGLKNCDKKLANMILNEVVDQGPPVNFKDIGELILDQFVDQGPLLRILVS